jgi:predicted pyridoxine 5'-phosphate oxidase superfamily flavin-nucleotide-binding protein
MTGRYLENHFTPEVLQAQEHYYGRFQRITPQPERDLLTEEELAFIAQRDSFYVATVASNGWPYIQHRGGPVGFLKVVEPNVLAFPDYQGNRQLLSTGNIASNNRVALFLMDYPRRERLKLMGYARAGDAREHPELVAQLVEPEAQRNVERVFLIDVVAFNWNCPKHITPRYTVQEIEELVAPLKARIADLEAKLEGQPK